MYILIHMLEQASIKPIIHVKPPFIWFSASWKIAGLKAGQTFTARSRIFLGGPSPLSKVRGPKYQGDLKSWGGPWTPLAVHVGSPVLTARANIFPRNCSCPRCMPPSQHFWEYGSEVLSIQVKFNICDMGGWDSSHCIPKRVEASFKRFNLFDNRKSPDEPHPALVRLETFCASHLKPLDNECLYAWWLSIIFSLNYDRRVIARIENNFHGCIMHKPLGGKRLVACVRFSNLARQTRCFIEKNADKTRCIRWKTRGDNAVTTWWNAVNHEMPVVTRF